MEVADIAETVDLQEEQVVVARVGWAVIQLTQHRQEQTGVQELSIMEVTTVAVEGGLRTTINIVQCLSAVEVVLEEAAQVQGIRMI